MISVENFKEFAGWPVPPQNAKGVLTDTVLISSLTSQNIQNHLDTSVSIVKDILGFEQTEDLPVHVRIHMGVFTLCLYLIENRFTQEKSIDLSIGSTIKEKKTQYFRGKLDKAIYRRVVSLIRPWQRVKAFIPSAEQTA